MDARGWLVERWRRSPWREAIPRILEPDFMENGFDQVIRTLYPSGGELCVSQTYRGRTELPDFRGLDVRGRDLSRASLSYMDLRYADFSGCLFSQTQLDACQLDDTRFIDAVFEAKSRLERNFAWGARFCHARFDGCGLIGNDFREADFSGARFDRCNFIDSWMIDARFKGLAMIDCDVLSVRVLARERHAAWLKNCTFRNGGQFVWTEPEVVTIRHGW